MGECFRQSRGSESDAAHRRARHDSEESLAAGAVPAPVKHGDRSRESSAFHRMPEQTDGRGQFGQWKRDCNSADRRPRGRERVRCGFQLGLQLHRRGYGGRVSPGFAGQIHGRAAYPHARGLEDHGAEFQNARTSGAVKCIRNVSNPTVRELTPWLRNVRSLGCAVWSLVPARHYCDSMTLPRRSTRFRLSVARSSSFSQRATTTVATPLPIMLTSARPVLMKRSIPRSNRMLATRNGGEAGRGGTRGKEGSAGAPPAPLDVRVATAKMVSCCMAVKCVLVA